MACCAFSLTAQCTGNLLNNGNFEDGVDGGGTPFSYYGFGTPVATTTDTPDGSATAGFSAASSGFNAIAQEVAGIGGETYTFSADVILSSMVGENASITMQFKNLDGSNDFYGVTVNTATWQNFSVTQVAPANVEFIQVYVQADMGSAIKADNFCLTAGAPPVDVADCTGNLLLNGALEDGITNWDGWGTYTASADAASGSGAAEIAANSGFQQFALVTPGMAYTFRNLGKVSPGGFGQVILKFVDASYSPVSGDFSARIWFEDQYEPHQVTAVAPAGAVRAQVFVSAGGGSTAFTDELCLVESTAPPATGTVTGNLIPDYSFENSMEWFEEGFGNFGADDKISNVNDPASGEKAVQISGIGPGSDGGALSYSVSTVSPTAEYTVEVSAKRLGSPDYAQMLFIWKDAGGVDIGSPEVQNISDNGNSYSNFTQVVTAPAGAASAVVALQVGANGYLYADDWSMIQSMAPLPIELGNFSARAEGAYNTVQWTTLSQEAVSHFEVQRSANGRGNWESFEIVSAGVDSRTEQTYTAFDRAPTTSCYYRMVSHDLDGATQVSPVVLVNRATTGGISISPNPTFGELNVVFEIADATPYQIIDLQGRELQSGQFNAGTRNHSLDLNRLATGVYLLHAGEHTVRFVKN